MIYGATCWELRIEEMENAAKVFLDETKLVRSN
jgi:hypothetical protein